MTRYEQVLVICVKFSDEDVIATSNHGDTPLEPIPMEDY